MAEAHAFSSLLVALWIAWDVCIGALVPCTHIVSTVIVAIMKRRGATRQPAKYFKRSIEGSGRPIRAQEQTEVFPMFASARRQAVVFCDNLEEGKRTPT